MINARAYTVELWMHLGGWLSTQEARVALGYQVFAAYLEGLGSAKPVKLIL